MTQLLAVFQLVFVAAQSLRSLQARLISLVHPLAVQLELWSRPSQEISASPGEDDFDELFTYFAIFVGGCFALSLLVAFCAGAALAWSCARVRERQPGRATTSAGGPLQAPRMPPRDRTPVPALQHARAQPVVPGSARRRTRSDPLSPRTLDFNNLERNSAQFPVPLCSPRAAPSAGGALGQPSEVGTSSSQDSRCRLRRVFYSP